MKMASRSWSLVPAILLWTAASGALRAQESTSPPPTMNLEALSRCVGKDVQLRTAVQRLEALQLQLQGETDAINARSASTQQASLQLKQDGAAIDELTRSVERDDGALRDLAAQLKQLRANSGTTEGEAARYNALAATYNQSANRLNAQLAEAKRAQAAFNAKVAAHNAEIADLQRVVADFKPRQEQFLAEWKLIEQKAAGYTQDCNAGHVLVK
jgi:chromosome segregation ATPase